MSRIDSMPGRACPRRQSGRVAPKQANLPGRLAARLVQSLVVGLDTTLRYRWEILPAADKAILAGPVIFTIWHNRLALCLCVYHRLVRRRLPDRRLAAMVSASRDGGVLARILELFEVRPVRGSSSRRGSQAMLELASWAERGLDLALTPDGPRGPRYVAQDGVVAAAQLTGRPVLPASFTLGWKHSLESWDRFQIPLPFSTVTVRVGEPVTISATASDAERIARRQLVQDRLRALTVD